ncbi:MAG: gliding motility protein GldC, partial [Dokdonia donghaensis]|nr:gliding motility protein GldC [Dokdonia donghaensis]
LVGMTDSFKRATNDEKMADTMKDFTDYFAEHLNLKEK